MSIEEQLDPQLLKHEVPARNTAEFDKQGILESWIPDSRLREIISNPPDGDIDAG